MSRKCNVQNQNPIIPLAKKSEAAHSSEAGDSGWARQAAVGQGGAKQNGGG